MLSRPRISQTNLKVLKSSGYSHNLSLFEQANNTVFTDHMQLTNTSDQVANKVVLILKLSITPQPTDMEILNCSHEYINNVYPNGIIQISFENLMIHPENAIQLSYRIRTGKSHLNKDEIILNNYLFFCF